jgi:NAD(P)-dependent dehydrogenase (short-subunit alcohol dehydrogenase family)
LGLCYGWTLCFLSSGVRHSFQAQRALKIPWEGLLMRMSGKVALVTGAGSGIGRATALRLGAEGAQVVCADTASDAAAETARAIGVDGGEAIALAADVTNETACAQMVEKTLARFGRLTTLVNSAGVRSERPDPTPPPHEWQRVVNVNLTGTYLASRAALPALTGSGAGSITNLASIYGLVGGATSSAYAASKGAIVNLTRQMALEWAPRVRVNCVCPGVIETPMTAELRRDPAWAEKALKRYPLGRFGQPDEIASAILYLASDEAGFVTGVALPVDGGYTAG